MHELNEGRSYNRLYPCHPDEGGTKLMHPRTPIPTKEGSTSVVNI